MSLYVFLTPNITNIGGAQMYLKNKSEWLSCKGFNVIIISGQNGDIEIKQLKQYKNSIIEGISKSPDFYYKNKINKIVKQVLAIIDNKREEVIIESNSITTAVWGELIAKHYNAKHLVYSLQESNKLNSKDYYNFFVFKKNRGELAGITPFSIPKMFNKDFADKRLCLKAYSSNEPENYEHHLITEIRPTDFTIASLGRLDKPFVLPVIKDIVSFAKKYNEFSFNLLLIGGSNNRIDKDSIIKIVEGVKNINLYITGFIYPVPLKLIQIADVFVSSSGACRISTQQKRLTISIDSNDHKPIGIVGITTDNTIFRISEPQIELSDLLYEILIDKKYNTSMIKDTPPRVIDYSEHMNFINISDKNNEYYTFQKFNSISILKKVSFNLLGANFYKKLQSLKRYAMLQK